jgi:hypothetical protein
MYIVTFTKKVNHFVDISFKSKIKINYKWEHCRENLLFWFSGSGYDIRKIHNQTRMLNINKTNKLGFDLKKIYYFITSIKNIFCKIDTGKYSAFVDVLNTLQILWKKFNFK